MAQERRMGRGLRALIGSDPDVTADSGGTLPIAAIRPGSTQPRMRLDEEPLEALAASIREHGILQPLLVRRSGEGYEIIAGERRWRAAKLAGLTEVPARVVAVESDGRALEIALVENVQREDLDPISRARAVRRLIDVFSLKQEQVATRVGLERSTVANLLRLLDLPQQVQDSVSRGTISAGHARALLSLRRPEEIERAAERVVREGLSVRAVESMTRERQGSPTRRASIQPRPAWSSELEGRLVEALGVRVRLDRRGKGWSIRIDCSSDAELAALADRVLDGPGVGTVTGPPGSSPTTEEVPPSAQR